MARSALRMAFFGAFGILYLWMAHQSATAQHPNWLVVLTGCVPLSFMLITWSWHTRARWLTIAAIVGVFALLLMNVEALLHRIVWVYFLQEFSCNLFACSMFALSLRPSSEALCTRLARMARSKMPQSVATYTRDITYAWAIFFGGCATLSAVLFLSGHLAAWSWFANVLNLPLVAAMFVVEYVVRICVIPKDDRAGIVETIRSVAAYGQHHSLPAASTGEHS
jgi:uncharacterized membrane protein